MSLNNRKALVDAWKFRIAALVTPLKDVFHGVPRKSAPTESASSATSALAALHAEVAASQDVVGKVMKRPLPSVLVADKVVPENLHKLLSSGLDVIATGPDKDYLPGTGDKVQSIIHPSLFPYIDGASTLRDPSILSHLSNDPLRQICGMEWAIFKQHWLPTQFYVGEDGSTSVRSYINNLDLSHQDLYRAIELSFSLFLPMFERILGTSLRSRELQVVVKAVNYIIQPGEKKIQGEWAREDTPHEHVIASGIYYYSTSPHLNDKGLAFRHNSRSISQVRTTEGRLLTFDKNPQYQVSGIFNKSKSKVGILKMLGFFLVDPEREILSTKHVPEQQWDRVRPRVMAALNEVVMRTTGRVMPTEILLEITKWAKTGFTLEEAQRYRAELVEEREYIVDNAYNSEPAMMKCKISFSD